MYEYKAETIRVIDGDTVVIDVDLGFGTWRRNVHVRLRGIDAPEVRTRNAADCIRGHEARLRLYTLLCASETLIVRTYRNKRSFNRYVADLEADGVDVAGWMVSNGYAAASKG